MCSVEDKNETSRFLGEGVSFKAKLIGILEVSEARGDRMCQEALSDLKTAIRAAGEHKQRITINIAIDGLRLRDEKTGDSLYHHPVHKISFIAQDMTDSRAFGYIFGSPDTGHRFFGIKTDKAASQVVIAMRDLFQVVFALKKKEIELAKQHLDKNRYSASSLISETNISSSKWHTSFHDTSKTSTESKAGSSTTERPTPAVADLVDLELELNSLQQGLNQMERITPSDPFGSKDDPFGDSFTPFPKPILPPPPSSGKDRTGRSTEFGSKTSHIIEARQSDVPNESQEINTSHDEPGSADWFTPPASNSLFEEPALVPEPQQDQHEITKKEILSQFDVFTDLDPLDPFGEDPFVKTDPFAETDFTKQDPFETDGIFNNKDVKNDFSEQCKFPIKSDLQTVFGGGALSKSPKNSTLEKQMSMLGTSPRGVQFSKQNTFDDKKFGTMQLHENPSLDLSSESECAPEPPPRPTNSSTQIKPPPLPPKKQPGEICSKPPPRPPHSEDVHYDFVDNYETAPNSLEYGRNLEKSPPLPVPVRKSKFESDFTTVPERPKKQFNVPNDEEEEEGYLTPISLPKYVAEKRGPILLPPPQKTNRKSPNFGQVTVASYLESKPSSPNETNTSDGLDITLSQLTLNGLNQLASKLNIPTSQLSNMTLVQLTSYLSNFIKNKTNDMETEMESEATFQADFANFNNFDKTGDTYDRYAVFRELLQEEIEQTKIDSEPLQTTEGKTEEDEVRQKINNNASTVDKYAALREIVEIEIKENGKGRSVEENEDENNFDLKEQNNIQIENEANIMNTEKFTDNDKVIEYNGPLDIKATTPVKSPVKSPINKTIKSPVPIAITEIAQNNSRLTSGSLSDVISGSSPEIDNTGSVSEIAKKDNDVTGESWAIFDQPNLMQETPKQNVQSEEGVSPWSSDSKEFGNVSPPEWRPRVDSGSGGERWNGRRRDQEGWWDTSAEPEVQYYPANRRSTDSYEDECYDRYERPRRRKQGVWPGQAVGAGGGHSSSSRDVSPWEEEPSRRREPKDHREGRQMWSSRHGRQHSFERHRDRRHTDSWDEEDDFEYEEEHSNRFHWQDRPGGRTFCFPEREERWAEDWSDDRKHRRRRETDRERWCCPDRNQVEAVDKPPPSRYSGGRWVDAPPPVKWRERKHEERKHEERKHEERYYNRDSQESPWEDEYSNEPDETRMPHYLTAKRNWKRPSSATETDRKMGELKSRQYSLGTGGSDGERDRRYKSNRRSKSRESQFSDTSHNRHKPDPGLTLRPRTKHQHLKGDYIQDVPPKKVIETTKLDQSNKKVSTASNRKKNKETPKSEDVFPRKTASHSQSPFENDFVTTETESPISACTNQRFTFENDFETSEAESPTLNRTKPQKMYASKLVLTKSYDSDFSRDVRSSKASFKDLKSARYQTKQKSLFEDDFSPTEKLELQETQGISSIKEEVSGVNEEEENSFVATHFNRGNGSRKKILSKNRNSRVDINLKKSESVNIFGREDDPFDDDFFSGKDNGDVTLGGDGGSSCNNKGKNSPRTAELKWTEQFEDFDTHVRK